MQHSNAVTAAYLFLHTHARVGHTRMTAGSLIEHLPSSRMLLPCSTRHLAPTRQHWSTPGSYSHSHPSHRLYVQSHTHWPMCAQFHLADISPGAEASSVPACCLYVCFVQAGQHPACYSMYGMHVCFAQAREHPACYSLYGMHVCFVQAGEQPACYSLYGMHVCFVQAREQPACSHVFTRSF